jgi:serine/threonine-protein kinase
MAGARFDMQGRLLAFYVVPPQVEATKGPASAPDWTPLFSQAQLDPARFRPAEPQWTPPFYCDARAAWEGTYPERLDVPIRLEAAAYRGRPVSFQVVAPWTRPDRMRPFQLPRGMRAAAIMGGTLFLTLLVISGFLAHRHLAAGRGDRAGAFRLAVYAAASGLLAWLLYADHVGDFVAEMGLDLRGLGLVLLLALVIWLLYLAVEPYVRRRWPHTLISWARVLNGNFADPRVGGDVLIGIAAGTVMAVLFALCFRLPGLLGQPALQPSLSGIEALLGNREVVAQMIFGPVDAAGVGMGLLLLLLLMRLVMPEWLAALTTVLVISLPGSLSSDLPLAFTWLLNGAGLAIPTLVLLRFGLLAAITTLYVMNELALTLSLMRAVGGWTSAPAAILLIVLAGLAAFAFRAATAGRRRV